MTLDFYVNDRPVSVIAEPGRRLLDILREDLGLTGTKNGCGEGECGACTVLLEGKAVNACLVLAIHLAGKRVVTIEGLMVSGELEPLQRAFVEEGAIQCGFCTSGMVMSAKALLMENPNPTDEDIRAAISGNICRCTGYSQVIRAIRRTAVEYSAMGETAGRMEGHCVGE